ncbi:GldG family protein [Bryobacter aggregatus]|uniref:GldG family protein n=1 Tax=Bryobacter aggregatus TaxID=360054 RepID=UPI0004E16FB1|nr:GldG family protein [Bryobacter aggregatus]
MNQRQRQYSIYSTFYVFVIIAVLGVANYLANKNNKTYDTTANKRYSLSDQTVKIVKGLKDDVNITYWDNSEGFGAARDILNQYTALSSKLKVEYADAVKKPALARAAGVTNFGTIVIESGKRREEAKGLTEEQITSALVRVLKGTDRTVCFAQGGGEKDLDKSTRDGFSAVKDLVEHDNYKIAKLNLLESSDIPAACTLVVIPGPRFDYPTASVDSLKKYVEGGGKALFMLDPPFNVEKLRVNENKALVDALASWGVTLNKDLVVDLSRVGQMMGGAVLAKDFDTHAVVSGMAGKPVVMSFPRSMEGKSTDKTTVEKLFSSMSSSFALTDLSKAELEPNPAKDKRGPFTMSVAGTYKTGQANKDGRFVVVGNSSFVDNGNVQLYGNSDLFLNMLAWLSADEDLISIRPKDPEDRRIQLEQGQMNTIIVVSQFVLPLIALGAAVYIWRKRR